MKITQDMYKATGDKVVLLVPVIKDKTPSGLYKSEKDKQDEAKERGLTLFCEVISVGMGVKEIEVGMMVLTPTMPTTLPDVEADNELYKLAYVREYDIVGYYTFD